MVRDDMRIICYRHGSQIVIIAGSLKTATKTNQRKKPQIFFHIHTMKFSSYYSIFFQNSICFAVVGPANCCGKMMIRVRCGVTYKVFFMRPIYYDTETTGTRPGKDRVIEIAAFDPVQNKTFSSLVNPQCSIPPESSAISHITDDMVKDAPVFGALADDFVTFCEGDTVLIAHNNDAFDQLFLEDEFSRIRRELPEWKFIDSLKWSRRYRSDLPRHSLQFLREVYKIETKQAHRALDDVIVLHQIFSRMIDDLPLDTVIDLLGRPQETTRMPFGKHQGKNLADVPKDYVEWLDNSGALDKKENASLREGFVKLGLLRKKE